MVLQMSIFFQEEPMSQCILGRRNNILKDAINLKKARELKEHYK